MDRRYARAKGVAGSFAVIFDLDGTLVDSAPDLHRAANALMAQIGAPAFQLAEITSFIGNGVPVLVERVMAARNITAERHTELVAEFLAIYEADSTALTRPYPGVEAALDRLARDGAALGICTNKPERPTRDILEALGLLDRFGAIVGGDSLSLRKPDPAPLLRAAEQLGAVNCVFVGDSEIDGETAARAEIPFVLFTEGYRKMPVRKIPHRATFSNFDALAEMIRQVVSRTE